MDFSLLYKRLLQLLTRPSGFWNQVKEDGRSVSEIRKSVVIPLLIPVSIASFLGTLIFSYNSLSIIYPLLKAVEYFLIFFLTIEIVSLILSEISGFLIKTKIHDLVYKLLVYSFTPFLLLMVITRLFSSLLFINVLGFWGLYILWKGIDELLGGDHNFRFRLFALYSSCSIIFYVGIRWIIQQLIEGLYLSIFG